MMFKSKGVSDSQFSSNATTLSTLNETCNGIIPKITSTPLNSHASSPVRNRLLLSPSTATQGTSRRYSLSEASPSRSKQKPNVSNSQMSAPLLATLSFKDNVSMYEETKSSGLARRIVLYNDESEHERKLTHQEKYNSPGLFPVVRLFKKDPPLLEQSPKRVKIKLSSPERLRSYSPQLVKGRILEEAIKPKFQRQSSLPLYSKSSDEGTKSVLEALKEISRKRIHANEEQDDTEDTGKRIRTELHNGSVVTAKRSRADSPLLDTSHSPTQKQSQKKFCVYDEFAASKSSSDFSFLTKAEPLRSKRKTISTSTESLITPKHVKVVNVETQTFTTVTDSKAKSNKIEAEETLKKKQLPLKVFDDAPLERIRKSRLAALMSNLAGKDAAIPVKSIAPDNKPEEPPEKPHEVSKLVTEEQDSNKTNIVAPPTEETPKDTVDQPDKSLISILSPPKSTTREPSPLKSDKHVQFNVTTNALVTQTSMSVITPIVSNVSSSASMEKATSSLVPSQSKLLNTTAAPAKPNVASLKAGGFKFDLKSPVGTSSTTSFSTDATPTFSFTKPNTENKVDNSGGVAKSSSSTEPTFGFGGLSKGGPSFDFGAATAQAKPQTSTAPPPPAGFSFGSNVNATTAAAAAAAVGPSKFGDLGLVPATTSATTAPGGFGNATSFSFGASSAKPTSGFGEGQKTPASSSFAFGSGGGGSAVAVATASSVFGSTFGLNTATVTTTSSTSTSNSIIPIVPAFGNQTVPPPFGGNQISKSPASVFGPTATASSGFNMAPSSSSSSTPVFGSTMAATSSVFSTPSISASVFGGVLSSTQSAFSPPPSISASAAFGTASAASTPGTTASMFNMPSSSTASVFGSSTTTAGATPIFGAANNNKSSSGPPNVFSGASTFGGTSKSPGAFGVAAPPAPSLFGAPAATSSAPPFGSGGAFSSPASTTATAFGTTGTFSFGSSKQAAPANPFGSTTTSASAAPFGTGGSAFGSGSTFGNATSAPGAFGVAGVLPSATENKPTFAFGATETKATSSSSSIFGSGPGGTSASFGKAASSQGGFGSAPGGFGSTNVSSGFNTQQINGSFNFGLNAPSTAATPFGFGAPSGGSEPPKPSFNFTGGTPNVPSFGGSSTTPAAFGGAAPVAPTFGGPAPPFAAAGSPATGVFNIGSGSSANGRHRTQLRAKRRT